MASDMSDAAEILKRMQAGDAVAADELLPLVYEELRVLAMHRISQEQPGHIFQATELVHEAYLRLIGSTNQANWDSCGHFFAAAAEAMRRILIDQARARQSAKRGGDWNRLDLTDLVSQGGEQGVDFLAINEVMSRFEQIEPRKAQLVKLRYFVGMTLREAAAVLQVSPKTADRDWAYARAWLQAELLKVQNS